MAASRLRLLEARERYLASRRARCSSATVTQDGWVTARFIAAVGDIYTFNLTAEHVEKWFDDLSSPHLCRDGRVRPEVTATTHNFYFARLKQFFHYLQGHGLTRHDLMAHVRPRKVDRRQRQQPTPEQMWQMLDNTDNARDRALLATAMNTGLRSAEIARLRVSDADMEELSLRVWISKSRVEDVLPITSDLASELRTWLGIYRASVLEHHARSLVSDNYLFPARRGSILQWVTNEDGNRENRLTDRGYAPDRPVRKLHRIVQQALGTVGLPTRHEGVHTLRRGSARAFFDRMVDERGYDGALRITSSLLHHSNCSTTETYLGLSAERRTRDDFMRGGSILGARPDHETQHEVVVELDPFRRRSDV